MHYACELDRPSSSDYDQSSSSSYIFGGYQQQQNFGSYDQGYRRYRNAPPFDKDDHSIVDEEDIEQI